MYSRCDSGRGGRLLAAGHKEKIEGNFFNRLPEMALCFSPDLCPTLDKIQGSGGGEEVRWKGGGRKLKGSSAEGGIK
jgi:hypothetical protein